MWSISSVLYQREGSRPLFIGHSVLPLEQSLLICGGGAVCFSFGATRNSILLWSPTISGPPYTTLSVQGLDVYGEDCSNTTNSPGDCAKLDTKDSGKEAYISSLSPKTLMSEVNSVNRQTVSSSVDFVQIVNARRPTVISGLNFGACHSLWNLENLKQALGVEKEVVVHQSDKTQLDFIGKNFEYRTKSFGSFADEISEGSRQYLRSLSRNNPLRTPANIRTDFPEIAADFTLPPQLDFVKDHLHSTVLRISGPVNMWLHYDVRPPREILEKLTQRNANRSWQMFYVNSKG